MSQAHRIFCGICLLVGLAIPVSAIRSQQAIRQVITPQNVDQLQSLRILGKGYVGSAHWSPDGKILAVGSTTGVWLYDTQDFSRSPRWLGNLDESASSILFSPDGRKLVAYNRLSKVSVWNLDTGLREKELTFDNQGFVQITDTGSGIENSPILDVSFDAQGRLLITSGTTDGGFHVLDAYTGKEILQGTEAFGAILDVAYSPDSKLFALSYGDIGNPGEVHIWSLPSANTPETLSVLSHSPVNSMAFSPDGRYFATGSGNTPSDFADHDQDLTVNLWDAKTRKIRFSLTGHSLWISKVVFSPDSRLLASGSGDDTLRLWSVNDGSLLAILKGHTGRIIDAAFSPDSKWLASVSGDGTVRIWNTETGREKGRLTDYSGLPYLYVGPSGPGISPSLSFASDDKTLGVQLVTGTLQVWNTETGHELPPPQFPAGIRPSAQQAIFLNPKLLDIWNKTAFSGPLTASTFFSSQFSPDAKYLLRPDDRNNGPAQLWSTQPLQDLGELPYIESPNDYDLIFSPDSQNIIAISLYNFAMPDNNREPPDIRIWNIAARKEEVRFSRPPISDFEEAAISWQFSQDGKRLVVVYKDGYVMEGDLQSGAVLHHLALNNDPVDAAWFSNDDAQVILLLHDHSIRFWNLHTAKLVITLKGIVDDGFSGVTLSNDNRLLFIANENLLQIYDTATGRLLRTITSRSLISTFGMNADNTLLTVMNDDDVVELWVVNNQPF